MAKKAKTAPSVPRVRRNGALMECGCWWYAGPGTASGFTKRVCPLHGETLMVKANVDEPSPEWMPTGRAEGTHHE